MNAPLTAAIETVARAYVALDDQYQRAVISGRTEDANAAREEMAGLFAVMPSTTHEALEDAINARLDATSAGWGE